jgi:ATP-dependent DNA helicase RecQ
MATPAARIRDIARDRFGYDELRPGQEEAVRALVDGRDTLVVMPTGSGKSAIYQIGALLLEGPTVVVSPLIALQRDQVAAIEGADAPPAAELNSTLSDAAREETLDALDERELEFVFLAPEQLASDETTERLRRARPSLFVVDEAHCISEWGHDFRPDYLRLGETIAELDHPRVLALTATAAPPVRREIVERLGLSDPAVIVHGFDRPNIRLSVETFHDDGAKIDALRERVADAPKPGIVYTATRARAEEIATRLSEGGVSAAPYHAGLAAGARAAVQEAFMRGDLEVVVATIAFGMGIDKADVRFVFHAEISDSVDSYYQEIGRAGRDGEPAEAVLFFRAEDVGLRRFFRASGDEERREFERSRVAMMRGYAELRDCRREFLLNYFGEASDEPCGFCDNCEAGLVVEDVRPPFDVGTRVRHDEWGDGEVQRYEGDKMVVLFETAGYKTLAVSLVQERALLAPI